MYVCAFKVTLCTLHDLGNFWYLAQASLPQAWTIQAFQIERITWSLCLERLVLTGGVWQSLQAAVQRVHAYVQTLEEKMDEMERKGRK